MSRLLIGLCLLAGLAGAAAQDKPQLFIDPGHGGADPGVRAAGLEEAALALEMAKELQKLLKDRGVASQLSRENGSETLAPSQRAQRANASGAKCFLALHINHSPNPSARGARLFIPKAGAEAAPDSPLGWAQGASAFAEASRRLALALVSSLSPAQSAKPPVQQLSLAAFRGLAMPAVVIELGYASHAESLERLKDPAWRSETLRKLAIALAGELKADPQP